MAAYTEVEWSLKLQSPAAVSDVYEFRVYAGSTAISTYAVTPSLTVTTAAVNYNETGRSVTIASTVASTDQADFKEPNLAVAVVSTVAITEAIKRKELNLAVAIVGTTSLTERNGYKQLALPVTVVATVALPVDQADYKETGGAGAPPSLFPFTEDFTGTNGASWDIVKWPYQRGGTVDIQSNAGRITAGGRPFGFTEIDVTDFELTVKTTWADLSGKFPEIGWRFNRGIGAGNPHQGYAVQMHSGSGGQVTMHRLDSYATVGSTVNDATLHAAVSVRWRIRVVGSNHKVRWWLDGSGEPGTWQMDFTDTNYLGGRIMLGGYAGTHTFDDLVVTDLSGLVAPKAARWDSFGGYEEPSTGLSATDFTIAGWFRLTTSPPLGSAPVFCTSDGGANYYILYVDVAPGELRLIRNGVQHVTSFFPAAGVWHHLSASYVNSTGITTIRITPEGGSTTTSTTAGSFGGITSAMTPFGVGIDYFSSFIGAIANCKVWTAALTSTELDTEMAHYTPQRATNLWAAWSFYNGAASAPPDLSGNGRNLSFPTAFSVPFSVAGPASVSSDVGAAGLVVPIVSTITSTDALTGGAVNYNETNRPVLIVATVSLSVDQADYDQLALPVAAVATITTPTDRYGRYDLGLAVAIVSTTTLAVDQADFKELARGVTVVAGITVTDLLTQPGHYDETNRTVSVLATLTLPIDQADFKDLDRSVAITATVTTPTDQADFKEPARPVAVIATVASTDLIKRGETARSIAITATVTTPTDRAGNKELTLPVAVVSTVAITSLIKYGELARPVAIVSTVTTPIERANRKELALPVAVVSAVTQPVDQADFKELVRPVIVTATIITLDIMSGAPINYNETGLKVIVISTCTSTDRAFFRSPQTISIVSTVTSTAVLRQFETGRLVTVVSTVASVDQADFKDPARPVLIASTLTLGEHVTRREVDRPVAIASTVTATSQADFIEVLALSAAVTFSSLDRVAAKDELRVLAIVATVSLFDLQFYAGGTVLNYALALYLGDQAVEAAYVGATKVWP